MIYIALFLSLLGSSTLVNNDDYNLGFKNGWMGYANDAFAISQFHSRCDALPDDTDEAAVADIWKECIEEAKRLESQWEALTREQKLAYPVDAFWKRYNGEPRRISKGPK